MYSPLILELESMNAIAALDAIASDGDAPEYARVGIDRVGKLEAPIIARLLAARKRTTAHGGTFTLVASRSDLLATLRVTGLDGIFTIEAA